MTFNIALNFEDGITRFIQCHAGEKVLDAAYRQQVNLPMDCSDGVCGTCKCRCVSGEYGLGDDFLEEALSEDEAAERQVLTCQMVPTSDCVIDVPAAAAQCKTALASLGAAVKQVNLLSDTAIELVVVLDEPLDFLPGQYINIEVPGTPQARAYSFSSLPGSREGSFLIRNVPGGLMSQWLTQRASPRRSSDAKRSDGQLLSARRRASTVAARGGHRLSAAALDAANAGYAAQHPARHLALWRDPRLRPGEN
ncbi:benzoate dioxygenase, ferredoxin reductase component [Klebsiella grimontii]|uniref:Benzoate dioxygenase, ferredoxin reductase component n=1 Tax=Klebsiella grimontii TaxID=2058152 RepID=A0A7H4P456_9ENTR|nr:benzoate dioxygenase, ferredoxin reductase component [Klebsiella grimontii]